MRAAIITPTMMEVREVADLRAEVGGYMECLSVGEDFMCLIDEDGKAKGLPVNPRATNIILRMLDKRGRMLLPGDVIVGPAIFVGVDEGIEGDLPQYVIEEYFL